LLCGTLGITAPVNLLDTRIKSPGAPHAIPSPQRGSTKPETPSMHPFYCRAIEGSRMKTLLPEPDLNNEIVTKAYARWAPDYDLVFGAIFEYGRQAAITAAERV